MIDAELEHLVETFIEVCRRVESKGFVSATDGNISARLPNGNILATPTSLNKAFVNPGDLIEMTIDGKQVAGKRKPSSEMDMHLFIYNNRADVNAIVHCHPVHATAFAVARIPLTDSVFPEVIIGLGSIPLAAYATPSTKEVSESIAPFVKTSDAILLSSHGVVTYGENLWDAYFKMEKVEQVAHIESIARNLGGVSSLSPDDISKLKAITSEYQQHTNLDNSVKRKEAESGDVDLSQEEILTIVDEVKKRMHQSSSMTNG